MWFFGNFSHILVFRKFQKKRNFFFRINVLLLKLKCFAYLHKMSGKEIDSLIESLHEREKMLGNMEKKPLWTMYTLMSFNSTHHISLSIPFHGELMLMPWIEWNVHISTWMRSLCGVFFPTLCRMSLTAMQRRSEWVYSKSQYFTHFSAWVEMAKFGENLKIKKKHLRKMWFKSFYHWIYRENSHSALWLWYKNKFVILRTTHVLLKITQFINLKA